MLTASITFMQSPYRVTGKEQVSLCSYEGPDVRKDIKLVKFTVYGPKEPEVGDSIVVFFDIEYVGDEDMIILEKIFVSAKLPDGTKREYEDKSYRGRTVNKGEVIKFHIEVSVDSKGVWSFWPSLEYKIGNNIISLTEPWHECQITVQEKRTTTQTQALPDLAFDPQHTRPIGYSACRGFFAYIKNIGTSPLPSSTEAEFWITSLATGTSWVRKAEIPALDKGESFVIDSGIFIGLPDNRYRVKVLLDPHKFVTEKSEFNNERTYTITYSRDSLPYLDIEISDMELLQNETLSVTIKHTGCLDSPPTTIHIGVEGMENGIWRGNVEEIASKSVPTLSGATEITVEFDNVLSLIHDNPRLSAYNIFRIHAWVDTVTLSFDVEGQMLHITEKSETNNRKALTVGLEATIKGPNVYFLPQGQTVYRISDPTNIWPVEYSSSVDYGEPSYTFEVEGCDSRISYDPDDLSELTINIPDYCQQGQIMLKITVENMVFKAEKYITFYLYDISDPTLGHGRLVNQCVSVNALRALEPFLFTDNPVIIRYRPINLLYPVTHTIGGDPSRGPIASTEEAHISLEVKWRKENNELAVYHVPEQSIEKSVNGQPIISFTIPREAIFEDAGTKALGQVEIHLTLRLGSGQVVEKEFTGYWLHDGITFPAYLRSFHFHNTPCPQLSWDMWEDFWGEDAVWDHICIFDNCIPLWEDMASKALYEYVFSKMCQFGRCSSYALVGQKFAESPIVVRAAGRCEGSRPQPFTLTLNSVVRVYEEPPSSSFNFDTMTLDSYLTYQYMWSLDYRNLKRGVDKLTRFILGEDIVLETLNELRAWQSLPDDVKWQNLYVVQMLSLENIQNSHTVLAYHVEEIRPDLVRVWVVDSNRPFQPNNSTNQDNSYIEFYCCRSDGRWDYRFKLDNSGRRVLDTFLFATPTSMLHGESDAFTEEDLLLGVVDLFYKLMSHMGSMPNSTLADDGSINPSLYIIGSEGNMKLLQLEDEDGRRAYSSSSFRTDPSTQSYKVVFIPIPAPMTSNAYMLIADGGIKVKLESVDDGIVEIVAENMERSMSIKYTGTMGTVSELTVSPEFLKVLNTDSTHYTIVTRVLKPGFAGELTLEVQAEGIPFIMNFSALDNIKITNLGDEDLALNVRVITYSSKYGSVEQNNESYKGISVSRDDTILISPNTWNKIGSSGLTIKIDRGSDGSIDRVEELNPSDTNRTTVTTGEEETRWFPIKRPELPSLPELSLTSLGIIALLVISILALLTRLNKKK